MDYVPFTLFFMGCLLCFQANMIHIVLGIPLDPVWPANCAGQYYCTEKPAAYPSDEYLKQLYFKTEIDFPILVGNETEQREGETICREHDYYVDPIYMIKDENNEVRYALNIPNIYKFDVKIRPCYPDANETIGEWQNELRCTQRYTRIPFIVLSRDMAGLESVKIKGLPTSCAPIYVETDY